MIARERDERDQSTTEHRSGSGSNTNNSGTVHSSTDTKNRRKYRPRLEGWLKSGSRPPIGGNSGNETDRIRLDRVISAECVACTIGCLAGALEQDPEVWMKTEKLLLLLLLSLLLLSLLILFLLLLLLLLSLSISLIQSNYYYHYYHYYCYYYDYYYYEYD